MAWWVTPGDGFIEAPTRAAVIADTGKPPIAGPFATMAAAQNWAFANPGGGPAPAPPAGPVSGGGQWWVGIRGTTIKVLQSASKPGGYSQVLGPYPTQAEARQVATTIGQPVTNRPTGNVSVPSGLTAVGDFFAKLGDRATWVRIVKVAVGAIMIIAGLARIGAPAAERIAGKLPKVIPV